MEIEDLSDTVFRPAQLPMAYSLATRDNDAALLRAAGDGGFRGTYSSVADFCSANIMHHLDARDERGRTPVMLAALHGHSRFLAELVCAKADPNLLSSNRSRNTASMYASDKGHVRTLRVLMQLRADPTIANCDGTTALQLAAVHGHVECVRMLATWHAVDHLDHADNRGATALSCAIREGHASVVRALVDHRASAENVDAEGHTVLMLACMQGSGEIASTLLESVEGAARTRQYVNYKGRCGITALHFACVRGSHDVVMRLLEASAAPNDAANDGNNALHFAARAVDDARRNSDKIIRGLLRFGAAVDQANCAHVTPLRATVDSRNHAAMVALLRGGASCDSATPTGSTPLMVAAAQGDKKAVRVLLDWGAEPGATNAQGSTAAAIAVAYGHSEIAHALKQREAKIALASDSVQIEDEVAQVGDKKGSAIEGVDGGSEKKKPKGNRKKRRKNKHADVATPNQSWDKQNTPQEAASPPIAASPSSSPGTLSSCVSEAPVMQCKDTDSDEGETAAHGIFSYLCCAMA